jgi:hypothetical protein
VFNAPLELALGHGAESTGPELVHTEEVLAEAPTLRATSDDACLRDGSGTRVSDHGAGVASGGAEYLHELVAA